MNEAVEAPGRRTPCLLAPSHLAANRDGAVYEFAT